MVPLLTQITGGLFAQAASPKAQRTSAMLLKIRRRFPSKSQTTRMFGSVLSAQTIAGCSASEYSPGPVNTRPSSPPSLPKIEVQWTTVHLIVALFHSTFQHFWESHGQHFEVSRCHFRSQKWCRFPTRKMVPHSVMPTVHSHRFPYKCVRCLQVAITKGGTISGVGKRHHFRCRKTAHFY